MRKQPTKQRPISRQYRTDKPRLIVRTVRVDEDLDQQLQDLLKKQGNRFSSLNNALYQIVKAGLAAISNESAPCTAKARL